MLPPPQRRTAPEMTKLWPFCRVATPTCRRLHTCCVIWLTRRSAVAFTRFERQVCVLRFCILFSAGGGCGFSLYCICVSVFIVTAVRDNCNVYNYVCTTTYQPDTKYNPNPNSTTKQHAIVNIQLNIVTCPTYSDKFFRDMLLHRLYYFRLWLLHWLVVECYLSRPCISIVFSLCCLSIAYCFLQINFNVLCCFIVLCFIIFSVFFRDQCAICCKK